MWASKVLVVLIGTCLMRRVDSSQAVMKDMTKNFMKAYEVCVKEYDLPDTTMPELLNFWKEGYAITTRTTGCAIFCLSSKLDLLDPEGKLHHGNTEEFAKQHGSDETVARQIVAILHKCENDAVKQEDKCLVALDVAMCFKKEIHTLNWAPDHELLMDELASEIAKKS